MRIDLTLPGFGGGATPAPPPPPAAPPPAPTQADAARAAAGRPGMARPRGPENIRNVGGGRGIPLMGSVQRALKSLTGQ
jgi:hypothetical protein